MSIDSTIARSLNNWGENHRSLVHLCSNDFVYLVIVASIVWLGLRLLKSEIGKLNLKAILIDLVYKSVVIFALPVAIATVVSEAISAMAVRDRPFVADKTINLLVPHGADGGMPSHHMVFMMALITSIYFYDKNFARILALLTFISGIARVSAGIHYPTDILLGILLGIAIAWGYREVLIRFASSDRINM